MPKASRQVQAASKPANKRKRAPKNNDQSFAPPGKRGQKTKAPAKQSLGSFVIRDSSEDEFGPAELPHKKCSMRPLPFDTSTVFPRFEKGDVYIIIHPSNPCFQYRLHEAILTRLSTELAQIIRQPVKEADRTLRNTATTAKCYIEINYSLALRTWTEGRKAFTTEDETTPLMNISASQPNNSCSSSKSQHAGFISPPHSITARSQDTSNMGSPMKPINPITDIEVSQVRVIDDVEMANVGSVKAGGDETHHISEPAPASIENHMTPDTEANQITSHAPEEATVPTVPTEPPIEICQAYNNIFLMFYNEAPNISTTSIDVAFSQCDEIVRIATRLSCLPAISSYLSNALYHFGRQLYLSVAKSPIAWLRLSSSLHSVSIFKEAIVHIVGKFLGSILEQETLLRNLSPLTQGLVRRKAYQLHEKIFQINESLFVSTIIIDGLKVSLSADDTSSFSTWLTVQLWREYFCRRLSACRCIPDQLGALYRTLSDSSNHYLPIGTVEDIQANITMQPVDLAQLSEDLMLMKGYASEVVAELVVNNSMLNLEEAGIEYLTCTEVHNHDLPWSVLLEEL